MDVYSLIHSVLIDSNIGKYIVLIDVWDTRLIGFKYSVGWDQRDVSTGENNVSTGKGKGKCRICMG